MPLPPTPDDATVIETRVRPQDVDPMGHVNNAAYIDYVEEALLASGDAAVAAMRALPRRVRIEYVAGRRPARPCWTGRRGAMTTPTTGAGRGA